MGTVNILTAHLRVLGRCATLYSAEGRSGRLIDQKYRAGFGETAATRSLYFDANVRLWPLADISGCTAHVR
jgi:hypothetical protein